MGLSGLVCMQSQSDQQVRPSRSGQVSIEYLIIVGFAFLLLIPLILLYYQSQNDISAQITSSQSDRIANEIVDAADAVYYLGPPTKKTFKAYLPEGVREVIIEDNYVLMKTMQLQGSPRSSVANLSGNLSPYPGLHIIKVEAVGAGVEITDEDS